MKIRVQYKKIIRITIILKTKYKENKTVIRKKKQLQNKLDNNHLNLQVKEFTTSKNKTV